MVSTLYTVCSALLLLIPHTKTPKFFIGARINHMDKVALFGPMVLHILASFLRASIMAWEFMSGLQGKNSSEDGKMVLR